MDTAYFKSPVGILEIHGNATGIAYTQFVKNVKKTAPVTSVHVKACLQQLKEYFEGKRKKFTLKLAPSGTPFQKKVWQALSRIPYGKTASYGEIAQRVGSPKASRAVGGANNKNPIGIIVPCHRVIGANGALVGYAGGISKKEKLLKLEGVLK